MPKPEGIYGDSKLRDERGLEKVDSTEFKAAIVRLPMVYGKNQKVIIRN